MKREEILEKLTEAYKVVMGGKLPECGVTAETDLRTDLGLSSVGMLYYVIVLESLFSIQFTGVSIEDFRTVGDVVGYIEEKQAS